MAAAKKRAAVHPRFAEKLKRRAQTEEEVFYPAAISLGEYLKMKLRAKMQKLVSSMTHIAPCSRVCVLEDN